MLCVVAFAPFDPFSDKERPSFPGPLSLRTSKPFTVSGGARVCDMAFPDGGPSLPSSLLLALSSSFPADAKAGGAAGAAAVAKGKHKMATDEALKILNLDGIKSLDLKALEAVRPTSILLLLLPFPTPP